MSYQLEISFSYGDDVANTRTMRRDVNWTERLDDLFSGMQAEQKENLALKIGEKQPPHADSRISGKANV